MATIITVHGTFAHVGSGPDAGSGAQLTYGTTPWWQSGSAFETDLRANVTAEDGTPVDVRPFIWSGNNSEMERREAGARLLSQMQSLEKAGESYCVVGHSHGGSVISSALMQSIGNRVPLDGLQRWITVGTPFVELRKERFLFLRLPLLLKAVFVASLMLLFMLGFYLIMEAIGGGRVFERQNRAIALGVAVVLTSLPFVLFYLIAKYLDRRKLFFYRNRIIAKAASLFTPKWLPLTHENDEAVNGLSSLKSVNLNIFHRDFAVPALSLISVFVLPLTYVYLVTSPTTMVAIADFLKDDVYAVEQYQAQEQAYRVDARELRRKRRELQRQQTKLDEAGQDVVAMSEARSRIKEIRREMRAMRTGLIQKYPELMQIQRVSRFRNRFLTQNGQPCANNQLCEGGRSLLINSRLLLHIVTDEVSSWVIDEEVRRSALGRFIGFLFPVLLVPIIFGLVAIAMVLLIQVIARVISNAASRYLDGLTWAEIKRSAVGNDTETEVAVGAANRPFWISDAQPFLPESVGQPITAHSNRVTAQSLAKFRNAISELAFAEKSEDKSNAVLSYLTWEELVHTSYFEVPEFRALVTAAISDVDGFKPTAEFASNSDRSAALQWIASRKSADRETSNG